MGGDLVLGHISPISQPPAPPAPPGNYCADRIFITI